MNTERLMYDTRVDISGDIVEPAYKGDNVITAVFAPDNKFCKYFGVALQSLIENSNPNYNYDILVFESDINQHNKRILLNMIPNNFSLRFFDIKGYIKNNFKNLKLNAKCRWSISMYYRIFIPLIMKDYDKVLYLDSDVCVLCDLVELFNQNYGNMEAAATKDSIVQVFSSWKGRREYFNECLGMDIPENYFNSGVLLFNVKQINPKEYIDKVYKASNLPGLTFPDQDMLNFIFYGKTYFLDKEYNYESGASKVNLSNEDYNKAMKVEQNAQIIHFTTDRKPWLFPNDYNSRIFWEYARKSPFYEEIIYNNTSAKLVILSNKKRIFIKYYFYKILSNLTFGKLHEILKEKRYKWKNYVNNYRQIKKLKSNY